MPPVVKERDAPGEPAGANDARGRGRDPCREDETILTECSYTDGPDEFARLAGRAGGNVERVWTDAQGLFSVQSCSSPAQ